MSMNCFWKIFQINFSWKNEFRQWIGDLQPRINVYLFNADDIAKKDRMQFLRRVSAVSSSGLI